MLKKQYGGFLQKILIKYVYNNENILFFIKKWHNFMLKWQKSCKNTFTKRKLGCSRNIHLYKIHKICYNT